MFIVNAKVQNSKEQNNLELMNELLIQATTFHLSIFILCSISQQSFFGYTYIYIVITTVVLNIIIIFKNIGL